MINAEKFKNIFGIYATELWSMPAKEFLKWLNAEESIQQNTSVWIKKYDKYRLYWYECLHCEGKPLKDKDGEIVFSEYCPHCGKLMLNGGERE